MLQLHAASAIVLGMCGFISGFGLGYLMRKPKVIWHIARVPADAPQGSVVEMQITDKPAQPSYGPDTIRRHGGA